MPAQQNASIAQCREALMTCIGRLKTPDYSVTIPRSHVYPMYDSKIVNSNLDSAYPKAFVVGESGKRKRNISNQVTKTYRFLIIIVLKQLTEPKPNELISTQLITDVVDDFSTILDLDDTLGGLVTDAQVTEFAVDSGVTYPEAIAVITVEILNLFGS